MAPAKFFILAATLVTMLGCNFEQGSKDKLPGEYQLISSLTSNSLDQVEVDVLFDFNCPACFHIEGELEKIKQIYGDRLILRYHAVSSTSNPEHSLRLFYSVGETSRSDAFRREIYSAHFSDRQHSPDAADLLAIARKFNLDQEYQQNRDSVSTTERIAAARHFAKTRQLLYTPAIIVEDRLDVTPNGRNITVVIDGLLKK